MKIRCAVGGRAVMARQLMGLGRSSDCLPPTELAYMVVRDRGLRGSTPNVNEGGMNGRNQHTH